jgi:hypothetical protein
MVYAGRVVPSLERQSARRAAYAVAMLPAGIASVLQLAHVFGFTTGSVRDDVILIAATVGVACSWGPIARGAIAVTGGPGALRDEPSTEEIAGAPSARAQSPRAVGYVLGVTLFILTMTTFTVPAIASLRTCLDTERILADAEPGKINPNPIEIAFSHNPPEYGAQFMLDFPMSLDLAAENKSDPAAREQLTAANFVGAHVRSWMAQDSNWIEAEVMEFATPEGAAAYQGQVNRYACGFANEAFEAPMGGIGLQVRYGSGAPYVEQVSWVAGNRRYKVQISAYQRPSEHGRILQIQEAATAAWPTDPPDAAADPSQTPVPEASVAPESIDEVRAALEATLAEGTAFINRRVQFEDSAGIPEDAAAFNGLVSLKAGGDLRGVIEPLATAHFDGNTMEVILHDSLIYLRGRAVDPLVGEGQWLAFDAGSKDPLAEQYASIVRGYNQASMALLSLYGVTHVTGVSDDVVHELPAHRYEVEIDLETALDAMPQKQRDRFRAHVAALREAGIATDLTADIWVAPDGLVHHIDFVQALGVETGGGSMRTSVDMFDFGVPLDLDIPEPELVTPVEDVKERNRGLAP